MTDQKILGEIIFLYIYIVSKMFVNDLEDRGSILGRTKDSKIALDAALLNTQHYKVRIKSSGAIQGKE